MSDIYTDNIARRDAALEKLKGEARSVGHTPGKGILGRQGDGLRPGADRIGLEIKLRQGRAVGLTPDRVRELGLDEAVDVWPITSQFLKGIEPHDRVRALHAAADQIRSEYGAAARGQVLTSSTLDENTLRELGEILSA